MVVINIYELIPSSITEIELDEMSLIQGGTGSLILSRDIFDNVPGLEAVSVLISDEELSERTDFSLGEIQNIFEFTPVTPAPLSSPIPSRRRRFFF